MFHICSFYKDISVTSLIAMKTETHKWLCNPTPHCVLSAMHCHRQQSQIPADTELNSCVACLALFIASRARKLKGCLGEGVVRTPAHTDTHACMCTHALQLLQPAIILCLWHTVDHTQCIQTDRCYHGNKGGCLFYMVRPGNIWTGHDFRHYVFPSHHCWVPTF